MREHPFRSGSLGVLAALILLLLAWATGSLSDSSAPRTAEQPGSASLAVRLPPSSRAAPPGPAPVQRTLSSESRWLTLVDVVSIRPVAGIRISAGAGEARETDLSGRVEVPVHAAEQFRIEDPQYRVVVPRDRPGSVGADGTVYVWRAVHVEGTVSALDGTSSADVRASVLASIAASPDGEWASDPSRTGSPRWIEEHAPGLARMPVTLQGDRLSAEVPASRCVTFLATADGFLPATGVVDTSEGTARERVRLVLERPRTFDLQVTDEHGAPIPGAAVQYFCIRRGSRADIRPAAELLVQRTGGHGLALRGGGASDRVEAAHVIQRVCDADGAAHLVQPAQATHEFLIVTAKGRNAVVVRRGDARWTAARLTVTLTKSAPPCARYRFLRGGTPVTKATVAVLEEVDGFTPGGHPVAVDSEGWFAADRIVAGRTYTVVIDTKSASATGRVGFGTDPAIETAGVFDWE